MIKNSTLAMVPLFWTSQVRARPKGHHYRSKSRQVTLDEWLRRPRTEKAFDNLIRMTSALM